MTARTLVVPVINLKIRRMLSKSLSKSPSVMLSVMLSKRTKRIPKRMLSRSRTKSRTKQAILMRLKREIKTLKNRIEMLKTIALQEIQVMRSSKKSTLSE